MKEGYDAAAIMGGLYGDGIIGLKRAFTPEFAHALYEDIMALFEEARQIPRGALPRGPARWYVETQPERIRGGGAVEGRRHPRPPVDDDRLAPFVLHVPPPDVPRRPGIAGRPFLVDAAEGEPWHVHVEGPQPLLQVPTGDLAVDGLRRHVLDRHRRLGPFPHRGQTSIGVIEMRLFGVQIWMGHHRSFPVESARGRARTPRTPE